MPKIKTLLLLLHIAASFSSFTGYVTIERLRFSSWEVAIDGVSIFTHWSRTKVRFTRDCSAYSSRYRIRSKSWHCSSPWCPPGSRSCPWHAFGGFLHCNPKSQPPRQGGRGVQAVHLDGRVGLVWPGLNLEDGEVGGGSEGTPQARFEHKRCQRPANKSKKSVFWFSPCIKYLIKVTRYLNRLRK